MPPTRVRTVSEGASSRGVAGRAAELERDRPFALLVDALDTAVATHANALAGVDVDARAELARLTPREQEVAALVGEGQTNAQIAARLQLSEHTVEKHVSSALAKLGVASRAAVVRLLALS